MVSKAKLKRDNLESLGATPSMVRVVLMHQDIQNFDAWMSSRDGGIREWRRGFGFRRVPKHLSSRHSPDGKNAMRN
jgi:hypothetical protein